MELKGVVIEYRPRLQSCYVFINFNKSVSEENVKVNVLQKSIIIKYIDDEDKDVDVKFKDMNLDQDSNKQKHVIFDTSEFFSLDNTSISGLTYSESEIMFRLQTEPNDTGNGSFKTELFTNLNETQKGTIDKYTMKLSELTPYAFLCRQCESELFSIKGFKRVLELPSENLDMSDWFCHKHDDGKQTKLKLEPNVDELFYKDNFIIINPKLLGVESGNNITCKECKYVMGQSAKNGAKLFNCTTEARNIVTNMPFSIFSYRDTTHETSLQDFMYLTRKFINSTNETFLLPQICKIIYVTNISENEKNYLLMWIVDKNLQVLTCKEESKLKSVNTTKLLYRIENDNGVLHKTWKDEIEGNISVEEIPLQIFEAGCQHLKLMAEYVSEKYRNVNEFVMTYLNL